MYMSDEISSYNAVKGHLQREHQRDEWDEHLPSASHPPVKRPCRVTATWLGTVARQEGSPRNDLPQPVTEAQREQHRRHQQRAWRKSHRAHQLLQGPDAGHLKTAGAALVAKPADVTSQGISPGGYIASLLETSPVTGEEGDLPGSAAVVSAGAADGPEVNDFWLHQLALLESGSDRVQLPRESVPDHRVPSVLESFHSSNGALALPCHCSDCELLAEVQSEWQGPPAFPVQHESMQISDGSRSSAARPETVIPATQPVRCSIFCHDSNSAAMDTMAQNGIPAFGPCPAEHVAAGNFAASFLPKATSSQAVWAVLAPRPSEKPLQGQDFQTCKPAHDHQEFFKSSTEVVPSRGQLAPPQLRYTPLPPSIRMKEECIPVTECHQVAPFFPAAIGVQESGFGSLSCMSGEEPVQCPPLTPEEMQPSALRAKLTEFAEAVAVDDQPRAQLLMEEVQHHANPQGTAPQRVAHFFLEALSSRMQGEGVLRWSLPAASQSKELWDCETEILKAMPHQNLISLIANSSFLEVTAGAQQIHVLDLGWWDSIQWPAFMQALAARPDPLPRLRITKLESPPGGLPPRQPRTSLGEVNRMLSRAAATLGLPFEFQSVETQLENLKPDMLKLRAGEVLLVNGSMRFHTLTDGSVMRSSPRDTALRAIHDLGPTAVVLGEKNVDANGPFFLRRFEEMLDFYLRVFDALDEGLPRDSDRRALFEKNVMGRDIINVVACEGLQRVARSEKADKWHARMVRAGFVTRQVSASTKDEITRMLAAYPQKEWGFCEDAHQAISLTWKGFPILAASVWRPAS